MNDYAPNNDAHPTPAAPERKKAGTTNQKKKGIIILIGLAIVIHTFYQHGNPLLPLLATGTLAPLFIISTNTPPKKGIRIILMSTVPVALAMYILPYIYTKLYYLLGLSIVYWFFLTVWILAPTFEELIKGALWFIEKGDWRVGVLVGAGFGIFESVSYQMHYGMYIYLIRWMAISLHASSSALFFQGLHTGRRCLIALSILLHIGYNVSIPFIMYFFGGI